MTAHIDEMSVGLPCHECGYDLRAHPHDGKCPECGASVEESARVDAIPHRPAWRDSDPRWRRRILAGVWLLVLLPFMDAIEAFDWASSVPIPNVFGFPYTVRTLEETFLFKMRVFKPLVFCMGVVLLFSKERNRRRNKLDWTRRWGILCSYVVLLLSAVHVLFISSLVLAGIAALFHSMPPKYQPGVTQWFVNMSTVYLRYGPYPNDSSTVVLAAFSSITILLACVPLFDALRSSGPKWVAATVLAPLALFSMVYLAQVGQYCVGFSNVTIAELYHYRIYFCPELLVSELTGRQMGLNVAGSIFRTSVEAIKWCSLFAIAVWLSIALLAAWWQRKKTTAGYPPTSA